MEILPAIALIISLSNALFLDKMPKWLIGKECDISNSTIY